MTGPDRSGELWLHLPQGRYRLSDDEDPPQVLDVLRGDDGLVLDVLDEDGTPGVVVLRPGAAPVALVGRPRRRFERPPGVGPSRHD